MKWETFFTLLFLLFAPIKNYAEEIPGYIGRQSFQLMDDDGLRNIYKNFEAAKYEFDRENKRVRQIGDQVLSFENQWKISNGNVNASLREIQSLENVKKTLEDKKNDLLKNPEANKETIIAVEKEISNTENQIGEQKRKNQNLMTENNSIKIKLDQVRRDFDTAFRNMESIKQEVETYRRDFEEYKNQLVREIKKINYNGAQAGLQDGTIDGADLSIKVGGEKGSRDGKEDGRREGTKDGEDRFYRRGAEEGERDGSRRAFYDGKRDGDLEGKAAGLENAAIIEGRIDGVKRAKSSDAESIGRSQGKVEGLKRAISEGTTLGSSIGEKEVVKKMEEGELKEESINGAFVGSFQRSSPQYPGDFNGINYRPEIRHQKKILEKAYSDGYYYNYREFTRFEFLRRIDSDYNNVYEKSYREKYEDFSRRDYPESFTRGKIDADRNAYGRDYPIVKKQAFDESFEKWDKNPDRNDSIFKEAYKNSENFTYKKVYNELFSAEFRRVEKEVFNANIKEQTEIFRQRRVVQTTEIYAKHPVLEFIKSEVIDAGINGVAALDEVFQPNEKIIYNFIIKNYGFKEATSVKVSLNNGESVILPKIPARSSAYIKGGASGVILEKANNTFKSFVRITSPLESSDPVEGRHYEIISRNVLRESDQKNIRVMYPLSLGGLDVEGLLLKGQKSKLKIVVTNNSKREYKGDLKIKLLVNSQHEIITKGFSEFSSLKASHSLNDAEVLINNDDDVYRELSFSAQVFQNGVLLGSLPQDFLTMAKAKFADKSGKIIFVAHSEVNLKFFMDTLSILGGIENVSVLDLSLASLNSEFLNNGFLGRSIVVLDENKGASIKTLNTFFAKSKDSSFVFLDSENTGVQNTLNLGALKDSTKVLFGKRPLFFSNPHRAEGVVKASVFFQSKRENLISDLELSQMLSSNAEKLFEEINRNVSPSNFSTPNNLIKIYSLKALAEVLSISKAYEESGNILNRDKKWVKMIKEDKNLFHNKLKAATSGDVVTSKLPLILTGIAVKEILSSSMAREENISKIIFSKVKGATNDVLDDMEDSYKKKLKKNFNELYNYAYENKKAHNPFYIPNEESQNTR